MQGGGEEAREECEGEEGEADQEGQGGVSVGEWEYGERRRRAKWIEGDGVDGERLGGTFGIAVGLSQVHLPRTFFFVRVALELADGWLQNDYQAAECAICEYSR